MGKIQSFKRLIKEDVEEQYRPLIEKIGFSVNNFADEVVNTINGNLTTDNLGEKIKDVVVTVNATGSPITATSFKTDLSGVVQGMWVVKAENVTNKATYPTSQPFITWSENNNVITVNNISGLQANNKYKLKVRLF